MGSDLNYLEPKVVQILKAPGTDLTTISAKRVRRQLLELDSSLTPEILKERKEDIDAIISRVFERVNSETNGGVDEPESSDSGSRKKRNRKGGDEDGEEDGEEEEEQSKRPAKKAKSSKTGQKLTADELLARKLSSEINGRPSRAGVKSSTKGRSTKKSTKKSPATVDSDGEGGSDSGSEKKVRRGGGGGFKKEFVLSEPLSEIVDAPKLSRPQVVKQLWVYIKGHELQNPNNRREIMCDSKMKAVFGVDKIDMFTMNKVLGKHLHEPEA